MTHNKKKDGDPNGRHNYNLRMFALTFDISELPVFLLLNISKTVADIFLIFYIWIHIDDMH